MLIIRGVKFSYKTILAIIKVRTKLNEKLCNKKTI